MDLGGQFDFWRMLLHTRAITPPRVTRSLWPQMAKQFSPRWLVLLAIVALSVGTALYVKNLPSQVVVVSRPAFTTAPGPAKSSLPW
jgi:hypothetical protein